jgi:protein ImuB
VAPTPLAAALLARANVRANVFTKQDLTRRLLPLPIETLRLKKHHNEALTSIGVGCIGDCRRLPRIGLARRFSPILNDMLDRLFGCVPDPRPVFKAPPTFEAMVELPWELDSAQILSVASERLLHELVGYLRANVALTQELRWGLIGSDNSRTHFKVTLTQPSRDFDHMFAVLRETLMRMTLKVSVRAIELYVGTIIHGRSPCADDLFQKTEQEHEENDVVFFDRLRSRCGDQALRSLALQRDHRPEAAWRWGRPEIKMYKEVPKSIDSCVTPMRPLWLLKRATTLKTKYGSPQCDGPLQLISERERIDTGWWDGDVVARDYFVATSPKGSRLWIYKELYGKRRWRLHGIFE